MKHKPYVPPSSAKKTTQFPRENVYNIVYCTLSSTQTSVRHAQMQRLTRVTFFLLCVDSSNILMFGTFFLIGNF